MASELTAPELTVPETVRPKRILSIDDDPILRRLVQMGLQKAGYETVVANNGAQARELLAQEPVDAILVDLMMPVMDSLRFLQWLRGEANSKVPALVFTSTLVPEILGSARQAGATDILTKPLRMEQLLANLRGVLGD